MGGDALINRFKLYIYGLDHVNASITYTRTPEILRFYLKKVSFESYAVSGCHIYKKICIVILIWLLLVPVQRTRQDLTTQNFLLTLFKRSIQILRDVVAFRNLSP